jgi:CheY-like chemotaxis protein|tara:strand:+ start:125 stop:550 length:426 start_codon:yes stop_codon:yes gene_type:complete
MPELEKKILIVDDEEIVIRTLGDFLEDEGYTIETAAGYDLALQKLEEAKGSGEKPDYYALILDLNIGSGLYMGAEVAKNAVKIGHNGLIVMCTSDIETAEEKTRELKEEELAKMHYLKKPIKLVELLSILDRGNNDYTSQS